MKFCRVAIAIAIVGIGPSFVSAQGRWDKFQQKLEEMRPKGKLLQQIKDSLGGEADKDEVNADDPLPSTAKQSAKSAPRSNRKLPAQPASQRSILNTSRQLPNDGVLLGIQIDPSFLPSQRLVVSEVDAGSPAEKAGIRTGDQITAVGGIPTASLSALDGVLESLNGGDQVVLEIIRNRKPAKTLVKFEGSTNAVESEPILPLESEPIEPPSQALLDAPVPQRSSTTADALQSVLSPKNAAIVGDGSRSADATSPPLGIRGTDDLSLATVEQLRLRIREQEQLIQQLQRQVQQLQSTSIPAVDEATEGETLILDADAD